MKMKVIALAVVVLCIGIESISAVIKPCNLRESAFGSVCVCDATYCDTLDDSETIPNGPNEFVVVSSSKGGLRFAVKKGQFSDEKFVVEDYKDASNRRQPEPSVIAVGSRNDYFPALAEVFGYQRNSKIFIDRKIQNQTITGFGGAFTGAVSHVLDEIPTVLQDEIYKSYYSNAGINFNMMRLSIGGCDFDLSPWAYNEFPENDLLLSSFTKLDSRDQHKVQQIKQLMKIAQNSDIKFMAAAWSPPRWMKSNKRWTGYSSLRKEYYQTWADYHLRFIELMAAENIPIWAISTGNEPLNGVIGWLFVRFMSLGWTPSNQAFWLGKNLGPTIKNSNFSHVQIFGNDDQRYTFPTWYMRMQETESTSLSYLDGFAVHWYWDEIFGPGLIDQTHEMFKDKLLLNTESCVGDKPGQTHGPEMGSWSRAEKYIRSYIQDLQHAFNGWIDWNIVLDERGGPNYVDNFVDAPVIVNLTSKTEFYKQPMFYGIGHFSKFIPKGSIRIQTERSNINLETVGFLRPDGLISVVVFNSGKASVDVTIWDSVRGNIVVNIPERSVHTITYR